MKKLWISAFMSLVILGAAAVRAESALKPQPYRMRVISVPRVKSNEKAPKQKNAQLAVRARGDRANAVMSVYLARVFLGMQQGSR